MPVGERRLTYLLLAACAAVALAAVAPRWLPTRGRLRIEHPDVRVSVEGAVESPGVYALPWGARVADLVAAAGGMVPGAARELVALADPLTDGEVVQVPGQPAPGGTPRVRLNAARPDELATLPGIGPALARRIVEARPFARVDDLLRVRGIGPATLERIRPRVGL